MLSKRLAVILATLLLVLAACGNGEQSVRGQMIDVRAHSLTEVETLRLQDAEGRVWEFETEGPIGFTPSHLREHRLIGQPVTVYYREEGERLVAVRVTD